MSYQGQDRDYLFFTAALNVVLEDMADDRKAYVLTGTHPLSLFTRGRMLTELKDLLEEVTVSRRAEREKWRNPKWRG